MLEDAKTWIKSARKIVVLTGAGISTESGIPDFRGPQGVWTRDPEAEKLSDISYYMADAQVRKKAWQTRLNSPVWQARPSAGHRAIVALEQQNRLDTLITQNIDGLHQVAGSSAEKVVEIHGTMRAVVCMQCGVKGPAESTLQRVRDGEADPPCLLCGGILKSATISFGQALNQTDLLRAEAAAQRCDLLLAVGSTLSVYPVAGVVPMAKHAGGKVIIVNGEPTQMDNIADAVIHGPIGDTLPLLVAN